MKRPKLKKASKRMTCAKRFKIQKKVREHHRKLRREAKKSGIKRKIKKDVGVPNSAPFKEEVLREAEQRKQELEELKEKNKLAKQKERAEKRKKGKDESTEETRAKKRKLKKAEKVKVQREVRAAVSKQKSSKLFRCSELNKVIEVSDVVLEVLDARDPMGCRCPQLEEAVLKHKGKKRLMFVLNKIDLVPKENLNKWVQYLKAQCPTFVFKSYAHLEDRTVVPKRQKISSIPENLCKAGKSLGHDSLMETLEHLANIQGSERMLNVGVVGFPNVGKSSVINSLKGSRACHAGVQRGLTKCMQEVHVSEKVKMIDSPALVAAPSNSGEKLALRSLEVDEREVNPIEAVNSLLKECNQQQIMLQYNVPNYKNSLDFLTIFAKKRGLLQKGTLPNTEQAAIIFLKDWTGAKLSFFSKVPEKQGFPPHLTQAILEEMQADLDLENINKANKQNIKCVRNPKISATIVFNSKGLTSGIVDVSDIPEEKQVQGEEEDEDGNDEDMEEIEDIEEIPESKKTKTRNQKSGKVNTVSFNIDLMAAQKNDNDAYDFGTDFV